VPDRREKQGRAKAATARTYTGRYWKYAAFDSMKKDALNLPYRPALSMQLPLKPASRC
jgi:hypothetical protein